MNSTKGKAGEKAVCSQCCGDETNTYYDRAFEIFKTYCNNVFFNKIGCVIENG